MQHVLFEVLDQCALRGKGGERYVIIITGLHAVRYSIEVWREGPFVYSWKRLDVMKFLLLIYS